MDKALKREINYEAETTMKQKNSASIETYIKKNALL